MNVLLVEDHKQYAIPIQRELVGHYGHEVQILHDPHDAKPALLDGDFDVVVVDMLFHPRVTTFEQRRRAGLVTLTGAELLVSGLSVLHTLVDAHLRTRSVVWTSGDPNRRLHLLFAHEELRTRAFCSKDSPGGTLDTLDDAIRSAAQGQPYADPALGFYLPADYAQPLRTTLLRDEPRRAIWRAVALGNQTRAAISAVTGLSPGHIGNLIPSMIKDDLALLDPGIQPSKAALTELARYAGQNWEFFLDDTVRVRFP